MWADLFTSDFAQAIWANLVASGAVAVGFYFAIDRRLRRAERMEQRNELVRDVLREVQRELDYDHDQAEVLLEHAPKGELPFPLFDVNGWTMLMQADVLSALDAKTLELLVMTYNRLRTSNEQWRLASDMLNGPTAVLAQGFTTIAGGTSEAFDLRRATVFNSLAERVTELLLVLDEARERVSTQLAEIEKSRPRKGSWQAVRRSELVVSSSVATTAPSADAAAFGSEPTSRPLVRDGVRTRWSISGTSGRRPRVARERRRPWLCWRRDRDAPTHAYARLGSDTCLTLSAERATVCR